MPFFCNGLTSAMHAPHKGARFLAIKTARRRYAVPLRRPELVAANKEAGRLELVVVDWGAGLPELVAADQATTNGGSTGAGASQATASRAHVPKNPRRFGGTSPGSSGFRTRPASRRRRTRRSAGRRWLGRTRGPAGHSCLWRTRSLAGRRGRGELGGPQAGVGYGERGGLSSRVGRGGLGGRPAGVGHGGRGDLPAGVGCANEEAGRLKVIAPPETANRPDGVCRRGQEVMPAEVGFG